MARVSCRFALPLVILALAALPAWSQSRDEQIREAEKSYEKGKDLMGREAFEEAERAFETALDHDPSFYLAQKRYPAAIEAYNQCVETAEDLNSQMQRRQLDADRKREDDLRDAQDALRRLRSQVSNAAETPGIQGRIITL